MWGCLQVGGGVGGVGLEGLGREVCDVGVAGQTLCVPSTSYAEVGGRRRRVGGRISASAPMEGRLGVQKSKRKGTESLHCSERDLNVPAMRVPFEEFVEPARDSVVDCGSGFLSATTQAQPGVMRERNFAQRWVAAALDTIEQALIPQLECKYPLSATADPRVQLEGNFSPVPESPVQHELEVTGKLPQALEGIYVRNGANPRFEPVAGHHFFDGDGMIQAVRFKNGIASHCCRFTRTYRLREEEIEGRAFFPKAIGELHGPGGIARLLVYFARTLVGLVDATQGMGVANAGLVYHNGRLLAMSEDDLPYNVQIKEDGDLETVGRMDFDGKLEHSMIAHPKVDPETNELFALSYNVIKAPYLKYFKISPEGVKGEDVPINLSEATMMHDFAITKNFVVVPDQQVVFKLTEMFSGGSPVVFDPRKKSRFGLLPKYASDDSQMQWIEVPDCFCFHLWNAWEEGDEVVILGSCMTPPDSIFNENPTPLKSILSEIRLNRKTGISTRRALADMNLEAGQLNRNRVGRKNRYLYMAIGEPWPKMSGVAKIDLECAAPQCHIDGSVQGKFAYPEGCYGGEPVFVPRNSDPDAPEDDGYVLTFVHNERTSESELLILDASKPSLDQIASVKMASRIPYGLHGTFITGQDLSMQQRYAA